MQTAPPKYQWRPLMEPEKATSDPLDHDLSDRDLSSHELSEDDCNHDPSAREKELFVPAILAARTTLGRLYTAANKVACDQGHRDVLREFCLLVAQSLGRQNSGCGPRWINGGDKRNPDRNQRHDQSI